MARVRAGPMPRDGASGIATHVIVMALKLFVPLPPNQDAGSLQAIAAAAILWKVELATS